MGPSGGQEQGATQHIPTSGMHFRWNKILKTLSFETVCPWVTQCGAYLDTIGILAAREKMLLLQYLEGSLLTLVEGYGDMNNARDRLGGLLAYVKSSQATIMRKLLYLKQNPKESIAALVIKFNSAGVGAGVKEGRKVEVGLCKSLNHSMAAKG